VDNGLLFAEEENARSGGAGTYTYDHPSIAHNTSCLNLGMMWLGLPSVHHLSFLQPWNFSVQVEGQSWIIASLAAYVRSSYAEQGFHSCIHPVFAPQEPCSPLSGLLCSPSPFQELTRRGCVRGYRCHRSSTLQQSVALESLPLKAFRRGDNLSDFFPHGQGLGMI
jgi:hypothetical protein